MYQTLYKEYLEDFERWLKMHKDEEIIGFSQHTDFCPIKRYLKNHHGVDANILKVSVRNKDGEPIFFLPVWAIAFREIVDMEPDITAITTKKALEFYYRSRMFEDLEV